MKRAWVVRAERNGRLYDAFKENSLMAIGWHEVGPLTDLKNREKIAALVAKTWPEWKPQAVSRHGRRATSPLSQRNASR